MTLNKFFGNDDVKSDQRCPTHALGNPVFTDLYGQIKVAGSYKRTCDEYKIIAGFYARNRRQRCGKIP